MSHHDDSVSAFSSALIAWQQNHGRHDLPWQHTRDAYRIWLSEIMLQQTQVATAIPYYARFLARFPNIHLLAEAPLSQVLELWAGLGYYARARNLHRCAQELVATHGGRFPRAPETLSTLPGIGRSTAAAISAFAYGTRAAILDGNVKRVLARCFGIEGFPGAADVEREMWSLAERLLPNAEIETYTQGLMDLGATCCTRAKPSCRECPMQRLCVACQTGRQGELPVAKPKKSLPTRDVTALILVAENHVLLERRPPTGIWGGLLALPECEPEALEATAEKLCLSILATASLPTYKHAFSHFRLNIQPLLAIVRPRANRAMEAHWQWLDLESTDKAALPTPVRRLLNAAVESPVLKAALAQHAP